MSTLNQVTLMGNVTRDIEIRYTPNGTAVGNIGLAMNRKWKDQANNLREEVTFVDLQVWGKSAEFVQKHFPKGTPMLVCGRLKTESWVDKATQKTRSKLIVVADEIKFCGQKRDGQKAQSAQIPQADEPGANDDGSVITDENGDPI